MASVMTYTATWTGFQGAPGYTKLRFFGTTTQSQVDLWGNAVRTFFFSAAGLLRTGWSVQVSGVVQENDVTSGQLLTEWTMTTTPAVVSGTNATGGWAGGVGAYIAWGTNVFFNGHRVRGRTFMVPLAGVSDVDGTLTAGTISTLNSAASALIAAGAPGLCIWSRQFSAPPNSAQINGTTALVTSGITRDKTGILRSRRD